MICSNRLPYKGNGQAIGDLIGGHVSMMMLSLSPIRRWRHARSNPADRDGLAYWHRSPTTVILWCSSTCRRSSSAFMNLAG
jgi:Tripartite tricarboxylate transporter family receptor